MDKEAKHKLIEQLMGIIDQAKFIKNILEGERYKNGEIGRIPTYVNELKEMTNSLDTNEYYRSK